MTADIDRPAGDYITDDMNAEARSPRPRWSEDGKYLFSLMSERGRTWIVRIVFPGSEAYETGPTESHYNLDRKDTWSDTVFDVEPLLAQDYRCFAFDYDGSGTVVGTISAPEHPGDVFVLPDATGEPEEWRRLTRVNRELLAQRRLAEPLPVAFEGSEGRQIEGWLLLPTDDPEAPYPLVLHVHGAPHIAYSMAFNYELQHLASRGYAVLFLNPHGSHTYGRDIVEGTQHDWGGKDYNDLMLGVDHIIEREDIDENRLGVAGGSYGGWMTNFIVTRTSRFEGAVAQRSSANRISTMFSSEVGYRHQRWEAPGYPWEALDYFCKISPVLHAHKVDTPLLLVHAEHDHLCPLMQPEEMFTALKSLGREVELLVFLDEHHHLPRVGKPVNRIERLRQTAEWFDNYVM
jgi:acylaminoacyl-peptidase